MIVVNLLGAPGSGKSTGAAYIFAKLKLAGINAELVQEFAKDKVYEGSDKVFKNQLYILGKQSFRLSRLASVVDVAVIDSPLLLSCFYNREGNEAAQAAFNKVVLDQHKKYTNMNYFISRAKEYSPTGRFQTENEANGIATIQRQMFLQMFEDIGERMPVIPGSEGGYDLIVADVLAYIKELKENANA